MGKKRRKDFHIHLRENASIKLMAAFLLFSPSLTSCKERSAGSNVAYIIGPTNDIVSVNGDNGDSVPADIFKATGLIVTRLQGEKVKYCSGSLAAPETPGGSLRIVTNHHCFAQTDERGLSSDLLLVEACTGTEIYLGFAPATGMAPQRGTCLPGSLRTNATMDLAVFTLSKALPDSYQPLAIWEGDPIPEGRSALIVHYPDIDTNLAIPPGQKTKLPMASITRENCAVSSLFTPEEWELDRSLPYGMRHSCDLVHGSSGSPLIDAETRRIIGVNWGGIKIKDNGPEKIDNVATRAVFLRQFLAGGGGTDGGSNNAALDAIAAQRAASTNAPKKHSRLPFGCGVASGPMSTASGSSVALILLLFFAPIVAVGVRRRSFAPRKTAALVLIWVATTPAPSLRAAVSDVPASARAAVHTQLINSVFALEYLAASAANGAPLKSRDALMIRARFAAEDSGTRSQILVEDSSFRAALGNGSGSTRSSLKKSDRAAVTQTFSGLSLRDWNQLQTAFEKLPDTCAPFRAEAPITTIKGLPKDRIACHLAATPLVPDQSRGNHPKDALAIISEFQNSENGTSDANSEFGQFLLAVASLRHLQQSNYPEALRALVQLQDHTPAWRLVYETVQRVYNYRQKGKGAVALNP